MVHRPVARQCRGLGRCGLHDPVRVEGLNRLKPRLGTVRAKLVEAGRVAPWRPAMTKREAVCDAITRMMIALPKQLRRSLTWDQGAEMAKHANLRIDTGLQIYFYDPQSPWQRGSNENTNGLLRQYFPKGTDSSKHSANEIAAVATSLNTRPRKTLGWKTPAEVLDQYLLSETNQPVATTD